MPDLYQVSTQLVADGRGILAADESVKTMSARLDDEGVDATPTSRRDYRELLLTTPGLEATVSGVILADETFNSTLTDGQPFAEACRDRGLLAGIKVDTGTAPLPNGGGATVTEGLDGLGARLADYARRGAAFAKWRAVVDVPTMSAYSLEVSAHSLARYAALCQEHSIVPIVEPEVLCSGRHGIEDSAVATESTLAVVFEHLERHSVDLGGMVLKPNMVTPGLDGPPESPGTVAIRTLEIMSAQVPPDVPGIAFLSGGHSNDRACEYLAAVNYLAAINEQAGSSPWAMTYSFGRALVSDALHTWKGDPEQVQPAQQALLTNCRRASKSLSGGLTRTVGPR